MVVGVVVGAVSGGGDVVDESVVVSELVVLSELVALIVVVVTSFGKVGVDGTRKPVAGASCPRSLAM
jgi:hypothetical protein